MLVYGTTIEQIAAAADNTHVEIIDLRENSVGIQFKLRSIPQSDGERLYGKRNPATGHRGVGVCFHGWHEFLKHLWEVSPQARVKTTKGFFDGYEEFREKLEELDEEYEIDGKPYRLSQACQCKMKGEMQ
jgi:hypothetical protein